MRLLVFRLSAMGDVALTVPALRSVLQSNPDLFITLVTRKTFTPFFEDIPRLRLITPDLNDYRGLTGLYRLFRYLKREGNAEAIADLHDVLRTKILRFFFRMSGTPVYRIDKGRKEKRRLIKGKIFRPLEHTVERYLDVFRNAGLAVQPVPGPFIHIPDKWKATLPDAKKEGLKIGIAPCARHLLKTWPYEKMIRLIQRIREEKKEAAIYLFGGSEDRDTLEKIASIDKEGIQHTLDLPLTGQLVLMQKLDIMISMDSANMHLAALLDLPVISIWGATHPYAGFGPWGQEEKWQVQIPKEELPCRPCTIYGKGTCRYGDLACLERITPEMVWEKIKLMIRQMPDAREKA